MNTHLILLLRFEVNLRYLIRTHKDRFRLKELSHLGSFNVGENLVLILISDSND